MTPESSLKPSNALNGVHGMHVVSHSPFSFQEIKQHADFNESAYGPSNTGSKQRLIVQKVWHQRPACLRPIHCCRTGDKNIAETVANVLTSLPFIALGLQAPRKNLNCKIYANSLIGVGIASSFYHASRGKLRKYLRWADYTMIATTTVCLSRALRNENPKLLMAASAFFLPIQPVMVSAVHTGMMEVAFAKRAFQDPELRMAHNVHKMSSLLGGALFVADDLLPQTPFLHAGWHLAAAVGREGMWMMESNNHEHGKELMRMSTSASTDGPKLRPLMPRPISSSNSTKSSSSTFSTITSTLPCCIRNPNNILTWNYPISMINTSGCVINDYCVKRDDEIIKTAPLVSGRWSPTREQVQALEEMYRRGIRTPSADQIQQIAAKLRRFGKIEGKNVFYWFQNHKARERQKKRRQLQLIPLPANKIHHQTLASAPPELRRRYFDIEHHKKLPNPSNCTTHSEDSAVSMHGSVIAEYCNKDGWTHKELQQKTTTPHKIQTSCRLDLSSCFSVQPITTADQEKTKPLITALNLSLLLPPKDLDHHNYIVRNEIKENDQTLELFPIGTGRSNDLHEPEIHDVSTTETKLRPNEFIEFLPTKN